MNAENQEEAVVVPDRNPEDVFEFGDRTIFTLRHQELQLDEGVSALSRQTIAAPLPPPGGDETMVMVGSASASLGFPASASPMLTPSTDPGDRTIVADPSLLPMGGAAPVEVIENEASLGTSPEERLERLEQKVDAAIRLMQTMQHRLDSMDAALARIIHR